MAKEEKPKTKSPLQWANEYFNYYGSIEVENEHGLKVLHKKLVYWRGEFYEWVDGIYRLAADLDEKIRGYVAGGGISPTPDYINNVKYNLRGSTYLVKARVLNTRLTDTKNLDEPIRAITTKNKIVVFGNDGSVTTTPLTPDFFSVVKLPYGYDETAVCPLWDKFLAEVTMGDRDLVRLLQQWAGYLLIPTHKYQCFLLCLGEGGMGKGTYFYVIMEMLGRENCSAVPIRRFSDRFSLSHTYGKLLNIAGDAEEDLNPQTEGMIKEWTGEDPMVFERKYEQGFTADATAKLMISANTFPTFTDKSDGSWRRLKIASFNRENSSFVDSDLRQKLKEELPGVLNWAIQGLKDLLSNNAFTLPERSIELRDTFKGEANPAGVFLLDNYVFVSASVGGVPVQQVYSRYAKWCRLKGYNPLSDKNFGREVIRLFPKVKRTRGEVKGVRVYLYQSLKLATDAEIRSPEFN